MRKRLEDWMPWLGLSGVTALGLGAALAFADVAGWLPNGQSSTDSSPTAQTATSMHANADSMVLALALQPPEQREESLRAIATAKPPTTETVRARYLLADDLIQQGQGGKAVPLLESLADEYPAMAAYSRIQLGKAHRASGDPAMAQDTWKQVLQQYGEQPAAAEALFHLGQKQPQYLDQLLQRFPGHPRSVEIAYKKLIETPDAPNEKSLLLVMAHHGINHPEVLTFIDKLVDNYAAQLTPEDWQAIGFAYWENQAYEASGKAYRQAPATARSLYRAARGAQLAEERAVAIAYYTALNGQFPDASETGLGLIRLSYLVEAEDALPLLDQVIERFPQRAGEALLEKAEIYDVLNSPDTAAKARDQLFTAYSDSEEAASLRSDYAHKAGNAGNWSEAIKWADQVLAENAADDHAAEMGFWSGKWLLRAGQTDTATQRFEQVIRDHPESYYAWRSAVALGWDVGDFRTVRSLQPEIVLPAQREPLPAGSETLQELYLLGQDRDAWNLWQAEFDTDHDPTVEEQFTDGVLRLGIGDNLDGIFMVSSLDWRDEPEEKAAHQQLKTHTAYWQTLYPFPYADLIQTWSAKRNLNPLLVTALIRQESRFQPQIRSVVGATGLMQVMPETAAWIESKSGIAANNLENPGDNINLGTWYLNYTHEEYGDHSLYAVASYNAGPGNVADWIARGGYVDEDDFAAKIPFPETKNYIQTVFGGYWNYLRLYNPAIAQRIEALQ